MEINAITLECDSAVNKPRTLFRFTKKRGEHWIIATRTHTGPMDIGINAIRGATRL